MHAEQTGKVQDDGHPMYDRHISYLIEFQLYENQRRTGEEIEKQEPGVRVT